MGALFTNDALDLELVNNQTGHATPGTGILNDASIGLVNSDSIAFNRATTLSSLLPIEGGFPGYARQAVTWNAASVADDGTVEAVGVVPEFRPSGSSTVSMYGLFMTTGSATVMAGCGPLDGAPVPMVDGTSQLTVTIRWQPETGGASVTLA
jgi:hypothetical protein